MRTIAQIKTAFLFVTEMLPSETICSKCAWPLRSHRRTAWWDLLGKTLEKDGKVHDAIPSHFHGHWNASRCALTCFAILYVQCDTQPWRGGVRAWSSLLAGYTWSSTEVQKDGISLELFGKEVCTHGFFFFKVYYWPGKQTGKWCVTTQ